MAIDTVEFIISKKDLVRGLGRVQSVADKKSAMPILCNVLIVAEAGGTVRLSATDLLLSVSGAVRADVRKPGSVALPARQLFDIVKSMPDGDVTVTINDKYCTRIKGGKRRFDLVGMPGDDFPTLPPADGVKLVQVPADDLGDIIALTSFSMSVDDSRPHLAATLFEITGETLRMVTTDGHRLSKAERVITGMNPGGQNMKLLIPSRGIHELKRIVDEAKSEKPAVAASGTTGTTVAASPATIGIGATNALGPVFITRADLVLSSKLVDAAFPSYEQVLPAPTDLGATVNRAQLLDALRAVSVVADDKTSGVKLSLCGPSADSKGAFVGARVVISSDNVDVGSGADEVDAEIKGDNLAIGFNAKYVIDVLSALTSEKVALRFTAELDPGVIRPLGREDFIGVLMPMRLT